MRPEPDSGFQCLGGELLPREHLRDARPPSADAAHVHEGETAMEKKKDSSVKTRVGSATVSWPSSASQATPQALRAEVPVTSAAIFTAATGTPARARAVWQSARTSARRRASMCSN